MITKLPVSYELCVADLISRLNSVLNVKTVVAAFNQEKALVGAFSVLTNLRMELFQALLDTRPQQTVYAAPAPPLR